MEFIPFQFNQIKVNSIPIFRLNEINKRSIEFDFDDFGYSNKFI